MFELPSITSLRSGRKSVRKMNRNHRGLTIVSLIVTTVLVAVAALAATPAQASGGCPTGPDACLIVNTNLDFDVRDDFLSLREAMMLDGGYLSYDRLTPAERNQVLMNHSDGLRGGGARNIYFDPTIFCDGCPSNRIMLQPPGWGGEGLGPGANPVALPPGFGGEAQPPGWGGEWLGDVAGLLMPPGWGGVGPFSGRMGLGLDAATGVEVPARATLDGNLLAGSLVGIRVATNGVWIRGLTFEGFPLLPSIEILESVSSDSVVGSNGDGILDVEESVHFVAVTTGVAIVTH